MKKILPILFLLFLINTLYMCKDDDYLHNSHLHENVEKKQISFKEFLTNVKDKNKVKKTIFSNFGGNENISQKEDLGWQIDTLQVNQIITPEKTTYTFAVIELTDTIQGFRNVIIEESLNDTKIYLVHYPNGIDNVNHSTSEVIVEELDGIIGKAKSCFELVYQCQACGSNTCDYAPGWVLVEVPCGGSDGGGGNDPGEGTPTDPIPGGLDPQDGGGGGGNNNNLPACQSLNNKLNEPLQNEQNFETRIEFLKQKVFNSGDEWGFINQNPSEDPNINSNANNQYNPARAKTLDDGRKAVIFDIYGPHIFGYMHTHPNNETTMGIHSAADILEFLKMVKYRYEMGLSTDDTYGIVVGNHGVYSLKIDNINDFMAGYGSYSGDLLREFIDNFKENYRDKVANRPISDNNQSKNEKALLQFLDLIKSDTGIGLYRATNDLNGWHKLQLTSNGQVQSIYCN